jgi:hypothetical protein
MMLPIELRLENPQREWQLVWMSFSSLVRRMEEVLGSNLAKLIGSDAAKTVQARKPAKREPTSVGELE